MQLQRILVILFIITTSLQACIKQVDVVTRNEAPILVVEGSITTDTLPYSVRLTYSGPIVSSEAIPEQYLEKDARVTISDDLGSSTPLVYKNDGIYETTNPLYIGKVGRSYSVTVELKNGKKYSSVPEKIKAPVPISKINVDFVSRFDINWPSYMNVSVNAQDPAGEENYYRWTFYSWVMRQSRGVGCGFGCIMYEYCYQKYIETEVHLLSDASINGNEIKNQTIGRCYIYTYANPLIDVAQISLTREAYQFWKRYQEQLTRTGSILDPLPASIKGNVYDAANPSDFALGYFSASSITRKRAILVPYSITAYWLTVSAGQLIPDKSIACFDAFEHTLRYSPPPAPQYPAPAGWQTAQQIPVYW